MRRDARAALLLPLSTGMETITVMMSASHRRRGVLALVVALAAFIGVFATALPADARAQPSATAGPSSATVTWAVRPANAAAPDGRVWIDRQLDPGTSLVEHLAVTNLGKQQVTFSLTGADGYFTSKGRFNMLPTEKKSKDAGTWISIPKTVTVAAGATAVVPFTIAVPTDATPGDHAAGVAASIVARGEDAKTSVSVESRVGFRVMVRVTGTLQPKLDASATGVYRTVWNPFQPGSVDVSYTLVNRGNVRIQARGGVDWAGASLAGEGNDKPTELLPGEQRTFHVRVPGVWPLGPVSAPVTVEQSMVTVDGTSTPLASLRLSADTWAMPWSQLIVLLAIGLIVVGLLWRKRSSTRRIEQLVSRAREEGRREASGIE